MEEIHTSFLDGNQTDIEYEEYYLNKSNIIYKIIVGKNKNNIFIKNKKYLLDFNNKELSLLINTTFNTMDIAYEYIINLFEENNVFIEKIIKNKEMKLKLKIDKERDRELILTYNNENKNNLIINEIIQLKNEINLLKDENKTLKNELNKLKKSEDNNNPKDLKLVSSVINDSYDHYGLNNAFIVFKTISEIFYIIYSTKNKSFICYNLNVNKKEKEINNYHNNIITNFRHFFDKEEKRDLIMSISADDNNIRLWNINNWECITNITNINNGGVLDSSCFLKENNKNYIITSNYNSEAGKSEQIKVFNFKGQLIKTINDSKDKTFFIDSYYDHILCKNYIITGNYSYLKSYDFSNNKVYHKYLDSKNIYNHFHFILVINKNKIKLIDGCDDGIIRIWNFHSGLLINKIESGKGLFKIFSLCLWNNNYIFFGSEDTIRLIELTNELIIKEFKGHNGFVNNIIKIIHPKYGESLLSQNVCNSNINLWSDKFDS